jgi:hypothetical protein
MNGKVIMSEQNAIAGAQDADSDIRPIRSGNCQGLLPSYRSSVGALALSRRQAEGLIIVGQSYVPIHTTAHRTQEDNADAEDQGADSSAFVPIITNWLHCISPIMQYAEIAQ